MVGIKNEWRWLEIVRRNMSESGREPLFEIMESLLFLFVFLYVAGTLNND